MFKPTLASEIKEAPRGAIERYGIVFPPETADWTIELFAYRHSKKLVGKADFSSLDEHFKKVAKPGPKAVRVWNTLN